MIYRAIYEKMDLVFCSLKVLIYHIFLESNQSPAFMKLVRCTDNRGSGWGGLVFTIH